MKNFEEITTYLRTSANYHFCNTFLPAWFFHSPRLFQALMASEYALRRSRPLFRRLSQGPTP